MRKRTSDKQARLRAPQFDPRVPEAVRGELRKIFEHLYYKKKLAGFKPVGLIGNYVVANQLQNWLVTTQP